MNQNELPWNCPFGWNFSFVWGWRRNIIYLHIRTKSCNSEKKLTFQAKFIVQYRNFMKMFVGPEKGRFDDHELCRSIYCCLNSLKPALRSNIKKSFVVVWVICILLQMKEVLHGVDVTPWSCCFDGFGLQTSVFDLIEGCPKWNRLHMYVLNQCQAVGTRE